MASDQPDAATGQWGGQMGDPLVKCGRSQHRTPELLTLLRRAEQTLMTECTGVAEGRVQHCVVTMEEARQ